MRKRIAFTVAATLLLLFAFGLGYWSGFLRARQGVRVIVARDTSDGQQTSGKTINVYEPYFTKQNKIPDRVR